MKAAASMFLDALLVLAVLVVAWAVFLFLGGAVAHLAVYVAHLIADVVHAGWESVS